MHIKTVNGGVGRTISMKRDILTSIHLRHLALEYFDVPLQRSTIMVPSLSSLVSIIPTRCAIAVSSSFENLWTRLRDRETFGSNFGISGTVRDNCYSTVLLKDVSDVSNKLNTVEIACSVICAWASLLDASFRVGILCIIVKYIQLKLGLVPKSRVWPVY